MYYFFFNKEEEKEKKSRELGERKEGGEREKIICSEFIGVLFFNSICQSFFPASICNMIQTPSSETSPPGDFVARLVAARPHAWKLSSLTFKNL